MALCIMSKCGGNGWGRWVKGGRGSAVERRRRTYARGFGGDIMALGIMSKCGEVGCALWRSADA